MKRRAMKRKNRDLMRRTWRYQTLIGLFELPTPILHSWDRKRRARGRRPFSCAEMSFAIHKLHLARHRLAAAKAQRRLYEWWSKKMDVAHGEIVVMKAASVGSSENSLRHVVTVLNDPETGPIHIFEAPGGSVSSVVDLMEQIAPGHVIVLGSSDKLTMLNASPPCKPFSSSIVVENEASPAIDAVAKHANENQIGTPISQLSGRPGHPGYDRFCDIASSWGYD